MVWADMVSLILTVIMSVVILSCKRSVNNYFPWSVSLGWCGSRSKYFTIREIVYTLFSIK